MKEQPKPDDLTLLDGITKRATHRARVAFRRANYDDAAEWDSLALRARTTYDALGAALNDAATIDEDMHRLEQRLQNPRPRRWEVHGVRLTPESAQ